jgi:aspartate 1-decarboxylase
MLKSKIHRAKVTNANINYEGSISIDKKLMDEADIRQYEQVNVLDINNGNRFTTYAIEAPAGSGEICLNGAAARLAVRGDLVIILTYDQIPEDKLENYTPKLVYVDANNQINQGKKLLHFLDKNEAGTDMSLLPNDYIK